MGRKIGLLATLLSGAALMGFGQVYPGSGPPQPGMGPQGMPQPGISRPGLGQPGIGEEPEQIPPARQQPRVDDATLRRQLHEQLASHPELADVTVTVEEGLVRLDGRVPHKEDRKQARELARTVPGVLGVKEKLTVDPNSGAVAGSTTGVAGREQSGGTTGVATGSSMGEPDVFQPAAAGAMAGSSESELAGQIQQALRQDPTLANDHIGVSVSESEIVLDGVVANGKAKQAAHRLAESFASNRKVVDRITTSGR